MMPTDRLAIARFLYDAPALPVIPAPGHTPEESAEVLREALLEYLVRNSPIEEEEGCCCNGDLHPGCREYPSEF